MLSLPTFAILACMKLHVPEIFLVPA